jgi:adenosylcobinamide kinase/adenosylcobinamide-phosphate guanylyltransferase
LQARSELVYIASSAFVERGKLVLVGGGVRSGKSALSLRLAAQLGARRAFVATAHAGDDEMRARIERHRRERAGAFDSVEAPLELAGALESLTGYDAVVVDCVTHWLTNLLLAEHATEAILRRVEVVVEVLRTAAFHTVLVTNEVGMSIHPETALGRAFVEVAGFANQRFARASDDVYFSVMGAVLPVRTSSRPPLLDVTL